MFACAACPCEVLRQMAAHTALASAKHQCLLLQRNLNTMLELAVGEQWLLHKLLMLELWAQLQQRGHLPKASATSKPLLP